MLGLFFVFIHFYWLQKYVYFILNISEVKNQSELYTEDFGHGAYPARIAFSLAWRLTAFTTLVSLVSHVVGFCFILPAPNITKAFRAKG